MLAPSSSYPPLGPEKSSLVGMLVRLFGGARGSSSQIRKVFLDLSDGPRKGDPAAIAEQCGFAAYGVEDTTAFTTVENREATGRAKCAV